MKGYCPGWASKALRPSFKNNTPVDVLTPSWCLGPSFENQEPARGSCAKTAQAAASPWFGEGSAADYWETAGEPFLLSACSQNKEPNFNFNFTFISTLNTCPRAWFFSSFNSQLNFTLFVSFITFINNLLLMSLFALC